MLRPADLVGVDLAALLASLGVPPSRVPSTIPRDFAIAVFAAAHVGAVGVPQARALCDLFDAGYDLVRAAWEVYQVQQDLPDLIDTLRRIVRGVDVDDLDRVHVKYSQERLSPSPPPAQHQYQQQQQAPTTSNISAGAGAGGESERAAVRQANAAIASAKQDVLKHSLEMMVKQSMLSANDAAGLFERFLDGDLLVEAAIETYAKDRNVTEFLDTLQILATHSREEIDSILRGDSNARPAATDSPAPTTRPVDPSPSPSSTTSNRPNTQMRSTLASVIQDLGKDELLDESSVNTLLTLLDRGDDRVYQAFESFSGSKDWSALLGTLTALADQGEEEIHTPDNPTYDYVDDSREDSEDNEEEEEEEEEDPLMDLPPAPAPRSRDASAQSARVVPPVPPSAPTAPQFVYSAEDMKQVLGVLHNAGAVDADQLGHLSALAEQSDAQLQGAFMAYRERKDIHQLLATLESLAAAPPASRTATTTAIRGATAGASAGARGNNNNATESVESDVESSFLRVVQGMQLSALETAALRLAIARSDDSIKAALDTFRQQRDEIALQGILRGIARQTIEDTLDEANYTVASPTGTTPASTAASVNTADEDASRILGTEAAREHVFPILISELVKEKILSAPVGNVLLGMFREKHPEIGRALDGYDARNDMAELVTKLQVPTYSTSYS